MCHHDNMTDVRPTPISVADAKKHFADVLGEVRYKGTRYIVERNGTPMAALVPLSDLPEQSRSKGVLALAGAFADAPELTEALTEAVAARRTQRSKPAPTLG